jgi:hypothetical protein
MNYVRIVLAGLCAFVAYMAAGGAMFAAFPVMKKEHMKYPAIYRSHEGIMRMMPVAMVAMLVSMMVLAVIWAKMYPAGAGWLQGLQYGALVGLFFEGSFVLHNWANLNIGGKLTAQQSAAYFVEWLVAGIVIALIYKPMH